MTLAEFLAWEERQETKYKFDGFEPVAMFRVTRAHSTNQGNVLAALIYRLRGSRCGAQGPELMVEVAGRIRYPDVFVACTPGSNDDKVITDPVVIFEILSEG